MSGYTNPFQSILDSPVWLESNDTRIVWVTLLAMANIRGEIHASEIELAGRARVTLDQCQIALACFDGRHIEEIAGGWRLLNPETNRNQSTVTDPETNRNQRQTVTRVAGYGKYLNESKSKENESDTSECNQRQTVTRDSGYGKYRNESTVTERNNNLSKERMRRYRERIRRNELVADISSQAQETKALIENAVALCNQSTVTNPETNRNQSTVTSSGYGKYRNESTVTGSASYRNTGRSSKSQENESDTSEHRDAGHNDDSLAAELLSSYSLPYVLKKDTPAAPPASCILSENTTKVKQKCQASELACGEPEKNSGSPQQPVLSLIDDSNFQLTAQDSTPQPVFLLPLNDGSNFPLMEQDIQQWQTFYPALDIPQQIRNMQAWLFANPKNRKTKNGIKHFINNWLIKDQNRAHTEKPTNGRIYDKAEDYKQACRAAARRACGLD